MCFHTYPDAPAAGERSGPAILFHSHQPRWAVVNATTLEIARSLAAGEGVETVAARLARRHGIPRATILGDIRRAAEALGRQGLFALEPPRPPQREPALRSAFLHLTSRCNLTCLHCYAAGSGRPRELETALVLRLIDELVESGARGVTLSGGEPLLHPDFRRILEYAAQRLPVRLLTNGLLLDDVLAAAMAGLDLRVQISLDGADAATHDRLRGPGGFAAALAAVERLQRAGLGERVNLSTTVNSLNAGQLPQILALADARGIPLVRFLPLSRRGRAAREWDLLGAGLSRRAQESFYEYAAAVARERRHRAEMSCGLSGFMLEVPDRQGDGIWCSVGRTVVVDAGGGLYPCVLLMEEGFRLGDARRDGLAGAIRSPAMARVCRELTGRRERIDECRVCAWRTLCQAGCMGQALDQRGTIWGRDDFCDYRRRAYRRAFDRLLEEEEARSRRRGGAATGLGGERAARDGRETARTATAG